MPEPRQGPETAAVVQAYRRIAQRLRQATTAGLVGTWQALPNLDDEVVAAWAARGGPQLDRAQAGVAAATAAYLVATAPEGQRTPVPVPPELVTSEALRGVPADELLHRAPEQAWYALSEGKEHPEAMYLAALRIAALVNTGLQLSHTHAARHVMTRRRVPTYRRAARANSCDLCALAARQTYRSADLMPIHHGCGCVVVPGWQGGDLDDRRTYDDEAYEDEVAVREHDEIGPVLTHQDHHFSPPHT